MRRDNRRVLERVVQWMIAEDVRIVHVLVLTTFQTMAAILFFKLIFSFEVLYRDFFCTREFNGKCAGAVNLNSTTCPLLGNKMEESSANYLIISYYCGLWFYDGLHFEKAKHTSLLKINCCVSYSTLIKSDTISLETFTAVITIKTCYQIWPSPNHHCHRCNFDLLK